MKRLGFIKLPPQYGKQCQWIHWQHNPSGGIVMFDSPKQRKSEAQIVRELIAAVIHVKSLELGRKIDSVIMKELNYNEQVQKK